jgi:AcrR family transcriptional regulator
MKSHKIAQKARKGAQLRSRRALQTADEILRAGLTVFSRKGFAAATMDDIASEIQSTRGLLYYHFKTKEEILEAILSKSNLTAGFDGMVAELGRMRARDALRLLIEGGLAFMENNRELVRFLHVHALLSTSEAQLLYQKVLKRFYDGVASLIEKLKRCGEVRKEVAPDDAAQAIVDLIISSFVQGQVFGPSVNRGPSYRQQLIEILLQGIAPEKRRAD